MFQEMPEDYNPQIYGEEGKFHKIIKEIDSLKLKEGIDSYMNRLEPEEREKLAHLLSLNADIDVFHRSHAVVIGRKVADEVIPSASLVPELQDEPRLTRRQFLSGLLVATSGLIASHIENRNILNEVIDSDVPLTHAQPFERLNSFMGILDRRGGSREAQTARRARQLINREVIERAAYGDERDTVLVREAFGLGLRRREAEFPVLPATHAPSLGGQNPGASGDAPSFSVKTYLESLRAQNISINSLFESKYLYEQFIKYIRAYQVGELSAKISLDLTDVLSEKAIPHENWVDSETPAFLVIDPTTTESQILTNLGFPADLKLTSSFLPSLFRHEEFLPKLQTNIYGVKVGLRSEQGAGGKSELVILFYFNDQM